MNIRSTLVGIAASAILLVVLGIARLFVVDMKVPDLEIREIETATIEPPPPPPPLEEPPPDAPPPPPALTSVSSLPDPSRVPIPQAQVPMDITAPVENFFADLAPAPLPVVPSPSQDSRPSTPTARPESGRRPASPPVIKSIYNANELDGMPRVLRHGSATFPRSLARKGVHRGAVILEIEISATGSVTLRRVVSASDPELAGPARRVASGARFTSPKKNGKPVKAIVHWPIVIEE